MEEYLSENGFTLIKEYHTEADRRPDFVVLAFDTTLTYEKLRIACDYITDGVEYWATSSRSCLSVRRAAPFLTPDPLWNISKAQPGNGLLLSQGKPNPCMIQVIIEKYGYDPQRVAVIGDRLNTDILSAVNAGVQSICVLTGEATMEEIRNTPENQKPTYVFQSIKDVYQILKSEEGGWK